MSRDLTADMQAEVVEPLVKPILMAEFDFDDGTLYMWSGYGSLTWNGNTYTGGGNLCGVSGYNETSDLASQGLTFVLNGIPPAMVSVALEENYQMRPARLYLAFVDTTQPPITLVADPYVLFDGPMDTMVATDDGQTASIKVNAENVTFILQQPNVHYYTDQDQQATYPGDTGLSFIAALQSAQVIWGVAAPSPGPQPGGTF